MSAVKTLIQNQENEQLLRGTVVHVTYSSRDTGFVVARVDAVDQGKTTLVGTYLSDLRAGQSLVARGVWQTHPKFGKQFKAFSITETLPTTTEAIARYLGSGIVRGLGPVLAERLVEEFGEDTLRIIDEEPERLREVAGVGEKKLDEIKSAWLQNSNQREVMLFFQSHQISLKLAGRIYNSYGDRAIETVKKNPYILAKELYGIGFIKADQVARALGIAADSIERMQAGLEYALRQAADEGHCFLPLSRLTEKTAELLQLESNQQCRLETALEQARLAGEVVIDTDAAYTPTLYSAEERTAREISSRIDNWSAPKSSIEQQLIDEMCDRKSFIQDQRGNNHVIQLADEQKEAIRMVATHVLSVITGGPGCGKTTVVKTLAEMLRKAGLHVGLAAPTGRAAQRLSEVCGIEASTIHRLLKFDPLSRTFIHDKDDPLPYTALIVDEASMIDIPLASSLLRAVAPGTRLVIVGDADQLPSVGPGLFLADLLSLKEVPRIRLTRLFRRGDESSITRVAHQINAAQIPIIPEPGDAKSDSYFLPAPNIEDAAKLIERLVVDQLPKKFGFKREEITVLSPVNLGELGVVSLNQRLQKQLIPKIHTETRVHSGNITFHLGDRVCQRVNNYNIHAAGVFNGDQGIIVGIDAAKHTLTVRLWDGREIEYGSDSIPQLDLAYALTIHRSQGSEIPAVVLALHDSHHVMLERQLLYTAVTRAKRLLVIVGSKRALQTATKRTRSRKRYTKLSERVVSADSLFQTNIPQS